MPVGTLVSAVQGQFLYEARHSHLCTLLSPFFPSLVARTVEPSAKIQLGSLWSEALPEGPCGAGCQTVFVAFRAYYYLHHFSLVLAIFLKLRF